MVGIRAALARRLVHSSHSCVIRLMRVRPRQDASPSGGAVASSGYLAPQAFIVTSRHTLRELLDRLDELTGRAVP